VLDIGSNTEHGEEAHVLDENGEGDEVRKNSDERAPASYLVVVSCLDGDHWKSLQEKFGQNLNSETVLQAEQNELIVMPPEPIMDEHVRLLEPSQELQLLKESIGNHVN